MMTMEVNVVYKKSQAVTAAKRFAKDRARGLGNQVTLKIYTKSGSLSKQHTYG